MTGETGRCDKAADVGRGSWAHKEFGLVPEGSRKL